MPVIALCRFAFVAMIFAASSATAQTQSSSSSGDRDTIVVNGKPLSRAEARVAAQTYVRGVVALPVSGQYARWKDAICPHVIGLSATNGAIVESKIRAVALDAGARVAKPGCRANLDIVFTDDSDAQIAVILRHSTRMMRQMSAADQDSLVHGTRPVRWWYGIRTEGADGHQIGGESAALLGASIEGGGPGFVSNGEGLYADGYDSTLVGTRVRSNFDSACIVVDFNRAAGKTLGAVAAYVSLIALAQVKLSATGAEDSVLALFESPASAITDLSRRDRAFLKALYRIPINRERQQQATAIAAEMTGLLALE